MGTRDNPDNAQYWRKKAYVRQGIIDELKARLDPNQPAPPDIRTRWESLAERRLGIIREQRGQIRDLEARITELEGSN